MKIYLASSWKNSALVLTMHQQLTDAGFQVDAFCNPNIGRYVFSFDEIRKEGIDIDNMDCREMLKQDKTQKAFREDKKWLDWCDCCIMLLPCGESSHLEGGYAKGSGKKLIIYKWDGLEKGAFDVMYGFADLVTDSYDEVIDFLKGGK